MRLESSTTVRNLNETLAIVTEETDVAEPTTVLRRGGIGDLVDDVFISARSLFADDSEVFLCKVETLDDTVPPILHQFAKSLSRVPVYIVRADGKVDGLAHDDGAKRCLVVVFVVAANIAAIVKVIVTVAAIITVIDICGVVAIWAVATIVRWDNDSRVAVAIGGVVAIDGRPTALISHDGE